jgi:hypothetical protein
VPSDEQLLFGILIRSRRYIARGWAAGNYAVDRAGTPVGFGSDAASAWSLEGAIKKSSYDLALTHILTETDRHRIVMAIFRRIEVHTGVLTPDRFNDATDRSRVLALLDDLLTSVTGV